jgi:hypothetical protein
VIVQGARFHSFAVELVDDQPAMVHRRPSCFGSQPGALSLMGYPLPVPWWEALADAAIDLGVPACERCARRAADLVHAYDLEVMNDAA